MNIVKPRITRDDIAGSGYVCRSLQPGLSCWKPGGSVTVFGTGDTPGEAYSDWQKKIIWHEGLFSEPLLLPGENDSIFKGVFK